MELDETLAALREKMALRTSLAAKCTELHRRRDEAQAQERTLRAAREREQRDVDRLEGGSLAAFFYAMTGKKEEKLTNERREAYAAAVKHDAVVAALHEIEAQLAQYDSRFAETEGTEAAFQQALARKAAYLKANAPAQAEAILAHESRIAHCTAQLREIDEAMAAGKAALREANGVLGELDSAEGWGTWDLLGGGLLTDMVKHSHLDEAQARVSALQAVLSRFKTELADVDISAELQVSIEGFLRFADYFWDGILADWAVLDHIENAQAQVREVAARINHALEQLEQLRQAGQAQRQQEQRALQERIEHA